MLTLASNFDYVKEKKTVEKLFPGKQQIWVSHVAIKASDPQSLTTLFYVGHSDLVGQ